MSSVLNTIIVIIAGLFGLGIVVFLHELGHLIAAKLAGITVEAFSIGWGKPLLRKKWKGTEYRISMIPIGGYCKMKGDEVFKKAIEEKAEHFEKVEGSIYSASAGKRIFTYFSGPLMNIITAILFFTVMFLTGSIEHTGSNKIIVPSEYETAADSPAEKAGLKSGDIISAINNIEVNDFIDISEEIIKNGKTRQLYTVLRGVETLNIYITPNENTKIGITRWVDPVITSVIRKSPAYHAGLMEDDTITAVNGSAIQNEFELGSLIYPGAGVYTIDYLRDGQPYKTEIHLTEKDQYVGFFLTYTKRRIKIGNFFTAVSYSIKEFTNTISLFFNTMGKLFTGQIKLSDAIGSPLRLIPEIGTQVKSSFEDGLGYGISDFLRILGLLSILLGITNLLPIPALDGGMILFNAVHFIAAKPLKPKIFYRYNLFGFLIIFAIMIFAIINDIIHLA